MRWIDKVLLRFRSLFSRVRIEQELDEELRFHLHQQIAENMAAGMTLEEARFAARRTIGGAEQIKEACRDTRAVHPIETLVRDVRYGFRMMRRSPTFTCVAVLSLALGIGANTAIFQLIDAVRLRALPVKSPEELVEIRIADWDWAAGAFSSREPYMTNPLWEEIHNRQEAFSGMFAWSDATFNLARGGEARYAHGLWVSGEFFNVLHISPMVGRLLTPADDRRGCGSSGVVVSYTFWQRELGSDTSAIGKKLLLDGHPFEVIGVTPASFRGVEAGRSFDMAVPLCAETFLRGDGARLDARDNWWLVVMGRLRPGWTMARAGAYLRGISPGLTEATVPQVYHAEEAKKYRAYRFNAFPVGAGNFSLRTAYETSLWMLLGISGLVLLIACSNLASLMLARASARQREIAVRLAFGASRGRVIRQLLSESLLLAIAGAMAGVFLAQSLSRLLVSLLSTEGDPLSFVLAPDWRVLSFTAGLALVTCATFSLTPALRVAQTAPDDALKASNRALTTDGERIGLRRALGVAQIAFAVVLLTGALLFARSLSNLWTQDAGFQSDGILIANLDVGRLNIPGTRQRAFKMELIDRVRRIPGVDSAANAIFSPIGGNGANNQFCMSGHAENWEHYSQFNVITPGYFQTLNTPLLAGRDFDERDTTTSPKVAIVNRQFTRDALKGENPIGKTFRVRADPGQPNPTYQIVGLVEDTKYNSLRDPFQSIIFLPESQDPDPDSNARIVIRSRMPIANITAAVKQAMREASPAIIIDFHVLKTQIRESLRKERLMATLAGFFGILATVLATIGLYGVISYSVARRASEIGIRIAIGAQRSSVVWMVLREALLMFSIGVAIGVPAALWLARTVSSMLYGLKFTNPSTIATVAIILFVVATIASYLPARRASRVDPMMALRYE